MSKKSVVKETRIWNTEPHPQYGFTFDVTMENGDVGRVGSKTNPMTYFVVGSEVEYEMEEKNKTDGSGTYIRIKKPSTGWTPGGSGGSGYKPKDKKTYLSDAISYYARYATDVLIAQGKEVNAETLKPLIYAYFEVTKPLFDKLHD